MQTRPTNKANYMCTEMFHSSMDTRASSDMDALAFSGVEKPKRYVAEQCQ